MADLSTYQVVVEVILYCYKNVPVLIFCFAFTYFTMAYSVRRVATCTQSTQLRTHCHSREHFMMLQSAIKSWPNALVDL